MTDRTCSLEGCTGKHKARGLCSPHYWRLQQEARKEQRRAAAAKRGPVVRHRSVRPPAERFWAKVDKDGPVPTYRPDLGQCWLWTGSGPRAYGTFQPGTRATDPKAYVHIWAWEQENGPVPEGLELDHLCVMPRCVRVSHLEPVTHAENRRRARLTRCRSGKHEITDETAQWDSNGNRRGCKECRHEREARRPPRRKKVDG